MTDSQYLWCCIGVALAIAVTGWALVQRLRARVVWRSITRRAAPDVWPYDWRVSCPELTRPQAWRVMDR